MALLIGLLSGLRRSGYKWSSSFCRFNTDSSCRLGFGIGISSEIYQFSRYIVDKYGDQSCTQCHGADYKGGINGVSCYKCHNGGPTGKHAPEWINPKFDIPPGVRSVSWHIRKWKRHKFVQSMPWFRSQRRHRSDKLYIVS